MGGGGGNLRVLLVVNCDLEPECVDSELRVALQWIAASELGLPALYFRKSKEKRAAKVDTHVRSTAQRGRRFIFQPNAPGWRVFSDYYDPVAGLQTEIRGLPSRTCGTVNPLYVARVCGGSIYSTRLFELPTLCGCFFYFYTTPHHHLSPLFLLQVTDSSIVIVQMSLGTSTSR